MSGAIELLEAARRRPAPARRARRGAADPAGDRRRQAVAPGSLQPQGARQGARARSASQARREADRAILDQTGIRALRREPVFRTPLPQARDIALDAPVRDDEGEPDAWAEAEARRDEAPRRRARSTTARTCYVCKTDFHELHHFYDQMCPPCAELNWQKRDQTADLRGRVALVTGARVKIGYQAAIKLLRAGAEVIVATRFPRDAARRFATRARRRATGRTASTSTASICATRRASSCSCQHLLATLPRLDALINNACQTVRRPVGLVRSRGRRRGRAAARRRSSAPSSSAIARCAASAALGSRQRSRAAASAIQAAGLWKSAVLSQVPLLAEDLERGDHLYPAGPPRPGSAAGRPARLQQLADDARRGPDRRAARGPPRQRGRAVRAQRAAPAAARRGPDARRARRQRLGDGGPVLPPLEDRQAPAHQHGEGRAQHDDAHLGDRLRARRHPHEQRRHRLGHRRGSGRATPRARRQIHGFHPPLDIVDGAARIVDPIFDGVNTGNHLWGLFLKDYKPAPW